MAGLAIAALIGAGVAAEAAPADLQRSDLAWLFPLPAGPRAAAGDPAAMVGLSGSSVRVAEAALHDTSAAIDWFPGRHGTPPAIVLKASKPEGAACGFCHLVGGNGRPENASLAGLPVAYIAAQARAFRAGTRRSMWHDWTPTAMMAGAATGASDAEITAAAQWFSHQAFASRTRVVETATVPATAPLGFILASVPGPRQPIAGRIIEVPDDRERFELRDPDSHFTAYVPPGSIARGKAVAARIGCVQCHATMMGGWGPGRSPSYIVRQLLAFKSGQRHDPAAGPMRAVVAQLREPEMIDVAAWFAAQVPKG